MDDLPEVLAFIPARGGSKGIPKKNLRSLGGIPLIAHTIRQARDSKHISRIVTSTDDESIASVAQEFGSEVPVLRPHEMATDSSPTIDAVTHMLSYLKMIEGYNPDFVIILQPTSPFRTAQHIDEALALMFANNHDSLVSVVKVPHNMVNESLMNQVDGSTLLFSKPEATRFRRQDKRTSYARNGAAIYVFRPELVYESNTIFGDPLIGYEMDKISSIDLDDHHDWQMAAALLDCQVSK